MDIGASGLDLGRCRFGRGRNHPFPGRIVTNHGDVAPPALGSNATVRIALDTPTIMTVTAGQAEN